jgi:V/A-type H+/Na+-transporting ATPase subunit E
MTKHESGGKAIISQGVESLIKRLKTEGVTAGKKEAENIIKRAQAQADKILNQAHEEAKLLFDQAHDNIQKEKQAAEDALQLAARNMRLELRQLLINRFKTEVKHLIHKELNNESIIRQLILLLAVDTADELRKFKEKEIEIRLPETVLDFDNIRKNPKLLENDPLKQLVQSVTSQMLRKGIHLTVNTEDKTEVGVKVRIVDDDIEMDLTEEAISELLLKHMQSRFRALLEGLLQ